MNGKEPSMWRKIGAAGKCSLALGAGWFVVFLFVVVLRGPFAVAWLANAFIFAAIGVCCLKLSRARLRADVKAWQYAQRYQDAVDTICTKDGLRLIAMGVLGCVLGPVCGIPLLFVFRAKRKRDGCSHALRLAVFLCVFGAVSHTLSMLIIVCVANGVNPFGWLEYVSN